MNFDQALKTLLKHEGGYIDHPNDPGGITNYGITQAVARQHGYTGDMRTIPMDVVSAIYRKAYWGTIRAEELPAPLRYPLFDAAVNSGTGQAVKWLQRALGVKDDGVMGDQTLAAIRQADADQLTRKMIGHRLVMLANLQHFAQFGKGWTRRVASILTEV